MNASSFFLLLLLLRLSFIASAVRPTPPTSIPNDTHSLTLFRLAVDSHSLLLPNWTGPDACSSSWLGVLCSSPSSRARRVISLSLPSLDLRGPLSALPPSLSALRLLDLHDNRLNSTLDSLFPSPDSFPNLRLLYLSRNDIFGPIPGSLPPRLVRLDLSDNSLDGTIPLGIANLSALLTLRLQNNQLSGELPDFPPSLRELDLSNNELAGAVPVEALTKFGSASFLGNAALCGPSPLPNCTGDVVNPGSRAGGASVTVPSNPSGLGDGHANIPRKKNGLGAGPIIAIVMANAVALVAVSFMVAYCCSRDKGLEDCGETGKRNSYASERRVYANGGGESDETSGTDRSRLVFFDRKKGFELEDLLRASAEMLGKGSLGTVYKAVLDDGCTVAVKRLKDANPCGRKEFEQYMELIGKVRHPNVAKLRAYYYAREEKLLVYDYLPNGSLHCLLHGY